MDHANSLTKDEALVRENEIMTIGGIDCYEKNGTAYLKLEAVARGLRFTRTAASGNEVIRWETVRKYLTELGVPTSWHEDSPKVGKDGLPKTIKNFCSITILNVPIFCKMIAEGMGSKKYTK